MSVTIAKPNFFGFLFLLCVGVPYLVNFELTFAVWSLTALLSLNTRYSLTILQFAACFGAILGVAMVVMFFHDYKGYYIFRDITYMLKPIIGLLLGYQLCARMYPKGFQIIAYTGVVIAALHLIVIVQAVLFLHAGNMNEIRLRAGFFSDFEVYALIILLFHQKFELGFSKKKLRFFTILVGVSSFMYLARTNFIQFAILLLAMKGILKINKTSLTVIVTLLALTIVGYTAIVYTNPKRNGPGIEGLLYKIKIAPREAFKTKIDSDDWKDFNDNYRSYENISTVKQVTKKGNLGIAFGEGIGSQIDLKKEVWLGDMYLRYISILHNGFMTVFLKAGLLGIIIYLYSIFLVFKQKKSNIPIVKNINLLLIGTGVFLIFSSWVFMGMYNLLDNKSILLGFLICYKEIRNKKEISSEE